MVLLNPIQSVLDNLMPNDESIIDKIFSLRVILGLGLVVILASKLGLVSK